MILRYFFNIAQSKNTNLLLILDILPLTKLLNHQNFQNWLDQRLVCFRDGDAVSQRLICLFDLLRSFVGGLVEIPLPPFAVLEESVLVGFKCENYIVHFWSVVLGVLLQIRKGEF